MSGSEEVKEVELITLDPGAMLKQGWVDTRDELLKELAAITAVDSQGALVTGGQLQTKAAKHIKKLDKIRLEANKAANAYVKNNNAQAKELGEKIGKEVARLKGLNNACATKIAADAEIERQRIAQVEADKEKARFEESERLAAAAPVTFGGVPVDSLTSSAPVEQVQPELPMAQLPTGKVNTGANAMVKVWKFDVIDVTRVPREFLSLDDKKVRSYIKYKSDMKETPEVAGIVFTSEIDVRSR